jgi:hypothetical protein
MKRKREGRKHIFYTNAKLLSPLLGEERGCFAGRRNYASTPNLSPAKHPLSLSECKIYIYIYFACTFLFKKYIYTYIFLIKTTFDLPKLKT